MRTLLLVCLLVTASSTFAQTPTPAPSQPRTAPKPATPTPAPATPPAPTSAPSRPRRAPATPTGRTGVALTVADDTGAPLSDIHVDLDGPSKNSGDTNAAGQVNFPGLQPGTYRVRFTGAGVMGFEREVTLRAGKIENFTITLTAAAAPKPVVEKAPAAPAPPKVGPVGSPQLGSLTNLADREKNTKERHDILLSCSGNTRNMLVVLTQEQPERLYDGAESTFYVVAGQGSARVGSIQSVISQGSFIAVPRGTAFTLARQGNRPLILLWTLSGEPCEEAR